VGRVELGLSETDSCHSDKYARGMYAARVMGELHEDIVAKLDENGIKYRPRNLMTDMD